MPPPSFCPVDKHGEKLGITVWTGCAAWRAAHLWNCPPHSTGHTPDLCPDSGTTESISETGQKHCPHPVDGTGEKGHTGTADKGKGGESDRWTVAGKKRGRTWTTEWPRKRPVFFPRIPPDIIYNMVISGLQKEKELPCIYKAGTGGGQRHNGKAVRTASSSGVWGKVCLRVTAVTCSEPGWGDTTVHLCQCHFQPGSDLSGHGVIQRSKVRGGPAHRPLSTRALSRGQCGPVGR